MIADRLDSRASIRVRAIHVRIPTHVYHVMGSNTHTMSVASVPGLPHEHLFALRADCVWEENIEKLGKAWAQTSREVDVR